VERVVVDRPTLTNCSKAKSRREAGAARDDATAAMDAEEEQRNTAGLRILSTEGDSDSIFAL
jgi:hypothetical protein